MKKNKITNFVIRHPYWSTLFVPFVGTIFFLFLFAYIKVLNLNSAIIILLGWIGWTIYCIVVCKGKRVKLIFDTLFIWVLIFLLLSSTFMFSSFRSITPTPGFDFSCYNSCKERNDESFCRQKCTLK